jgi:hypothetical protein
LDRKHGSDFREVARLVKAWKCLHSVSISSDPSPSMPGWLICVRNFPWSSLLIPKQAL